MLPMAAMGVATLVSYERAKAEGLGYNAKGGLMERAERTIALIAALAFPVLLIPVLWLMLALTSFTAVHRFVMVWRQASKPPKPEIAPRVRRSPAERRTWADRAERWRAWREQFATRRPPAPPRRPPRARQPSPLVDAAVTQTLSAAGAVLAG